MSSESSTSPADAGRGREGQQSTPLDDTLTGAQHQDLFRVDAGSQVVENNSFVLRVNIRLHNGTFVHATGFGQLPGMNGMAGTHA